MGFSHFCELYWLKFYHFPRRMGKKTPGRTNSLIYYFHSGPLLPLSWKDRRGSVGTANVRRQSFVALIMWQSAITKRNHHSVNSAFEVTKMFRICKRIPRLPLKVVRSWLHPYPRTQLSLLFLKNEIVILIRPLSMGLRSCFGGSGPGEVGGDRNCFVRGVNSHFFPFNHTGKHCTFSNFN